MSPIGETRILRLTQEDEPEILQEALTAVERGQLLVFPTDTVYGIGGGAFISSVYNRLMELKGSRELKAYALLIANKEIMERIAGRALEGAALRLAQRFWPGALTIVWHASLAISREFTAPDGSVGYRVPDHAFLRRLMQAGDGALWATSANRAGLPPPAIFRAIENVVMEKAVLAIESDDKLAGTPSTVVDARIQPVKILREGGISAREIHAFLSEVSRK
ncbi:MAG: L-threonylcarbamoyladenylate synthase [Calditrichaeota bacterium]|nr:L-threonylcarbamoyladenylate synthase [Calditrichota bacterium]